MKERPTWDRIFGSSVSCIGGHDYGKSTRTLISVEDKRGKMVNIRFKMKVDMTRRKVLMLSKEDTRQNNLTNEGTMVLRCQS
jgi:hypothetical protein